MQRPEWIEPSVSATAGPALHPDPLLHHLLAARGVGATTVEAFLDERPVPAPDPSRLPGMTAAAERVHQAIDTGERIAIFGDYDVDGVAATALLALAIQRATKGGERPLAHLPTRADGYGLNPAALATMAATGVSLLIAVDCASGDHANLGRARALGLDVVVLDHHQLDGPVPPGAIIASAQLDPAAPYGEMAAVGLAYLLAVALTQRGVDLGRGPHKEPIDLRDLVALGTIADVAPLTGVNRPLVRDGLRRLAGRPRVGIRAIRERAGMTGPTLTSEDVAFKIAPRLNAAGRMADPRLALDLLLTDDPAEATRLASELERLNGQRRTASERVIADAEAILRARPELTNRRLMVLAKHDWGHGVLGLAAGKLAERFGRPVVILADDGELSRGSARSVPGFDIGRALAGCSDLLTAHGGHSQAAGLTLCTAVVPRLTDALEAAIVAADLPLPGPASLQIDADLPPDRLNAGTVETINLLQPFGAGNAAPLLRLRDVPVRSYTAIGRDSSHLKLHLETSRGVIPALFWSAADRSRELIRQPRLDLLVTLGFDHWNGQRRLQVEVKDFRVAR